MGFSNMSRHKRQRLDIAQIREALRDGKIWTALGVVTVFPGESSHFEIDADGGGVIVDVELVPHRERVACRLGSGSGGGVWRIPPAGAEVAVLVPSGELEADPMIVAVVSDPPTQLTDETETVIVATGTVKVIAPAVELGDSPAALDGVVVGTGIDSFTGATYTALGNASAVVKAKK